MGKRIKVKKRKQRDLLLTGVLENEGVGETIKNLSRVDVVRLRDLSVLHLAPGAKPGRLTIWSKSAFEKLDEVVLGGVG